MVASLVCIQVYLSDMVSRRSFGRFFRNTPRKVRFSTPPTLEPPNPRTYNPRTSPYLQPYNLTTPATLELTTLEPLHNLNPRTYNPESSLHLQPWNLQP